MATPSRALPDCQYVGTFTIDNVFRNSVRQAFNVWSSQVKIPSMKVSVVFSLGNLCLAQFCL
jgi:hypothetical protein